MEPVSGHAPIFTPDYPESVRWSPCNPDIIDAGPDLFCLYQINPQCAPCLFVLPLTAIMTDDSKSYDCLPVGGITIAQVSIELTTKAKVRKGLPLDVSRHRIGFVSIKNKAACQ